MEQMLLAIRRHKNAFRVRHEWYSIMTEISWMMQEIITVRWAGLLRGEKEKY